MVGPALKSNADVSTYKAGPKAEIASAPDGNTAYYLNSSGHF